ncbi:DNA polymerase III subunit gamma/tau [Candidatus Saccharibacteria bacterium]|nr:DNA polymerase III subunit gamma/tau [Candidatus Saccharibacteria bacterium]
MGQALYRKYRSRSFDELVGQEHITSTLVQAVQRGAVSHAYLFTGPRGVGKTSVARILAHAINNLEYSDTPHLDIIEIDAASNRRVEDVRDLREKVHIAPTSAPYKVYIIDEVHMLTTESFNALLKTLEEPPAHVVFILATTELHKLPATITSRTQRFAFHAPSPEIITGHLRTLAEKEQISLDDDALSLIAEHGDGSFRDSVSLLDQVRGLASPGQTIDEQAVARLLGLPPRAAISELAEAALGGDATAVAAQLKQLEARGISPATLALQLIRHCMQLAASQPAARHMLDGLVHVARSSHPAASLLLALLPAGQPVAASASAPAAAPAPRSATPARAASPAPAPASSVPASTPATPAAPPPPPVARTSSSSRKKALPVEEEEETEDSATAVTAAMTGPAVNFDFSLIQQRWGNILETIKADSPALVGILKTVAIAEVNGGLGMTCKYAIHKNQLEQARHKLAFGKAVAAITNIAHFEVTVSVDSNVTPAEPLTQALPPTPEAESVLDVMGGGEMVQYSA